MSISTETEVWKPGDLRSVVEMAVLLNISGCVIKNLLGEELSPKAMENWNEALAVSIKTKLEGSV